MHNKEFKLEVGRGYLDSNFKVVYFDKHNNVNLEGNIKSDNNVNLEGNIKSVSNRVFTKSGKEVNDTNVSIICPLDKDLFELASNLYGKNNELLVALIQFYRFVKIYQSETQCYSYLESIILNNRIFEGRDIQLSLPYVGTKVETETKYYNEFTVNMLSNKVGRKILFLIDDSKNGTLYKLSDCCDIAFK